MRLTVPELAAAMGLTTRSVEYAVRAGLPSVGRRGRARLYDLEKSRTWWSANRATKSGRPRGSTPGVAQAVELDPLSPAQILDLVRDGKLLPGQVATYSAAIAAMSRGIEVRRKAGLLVESSTVSNDLRQALGRARSCVDRVPEALLAALCAVVSLTDEQRTAVRAAARAQCDQLLDALAAAGGDAR